MNLRSMKNELAKNKANLEFAKRTINLLKKGNPVNKDLLKESVLVKQELERRIVELKKAIAKAEKK